MPHINRTFFAAVLLAALLIGVAATVAYAATVAAAPAAAPNIFGQIGSATSNALGAGVNIVIGFLLSLWIYFAGGLLILFTKGLIYVAGINNFIGATAVVEGWKIVRDICNMFFVLILLIIAIGTILQQEKYHYSKLLPQFITMAIMINFSKTICGILIDAAQVVMLTFVGAFSGAAGGNFFALLGLYDLWNVVTGIGETVTKEKGDGFGVAIATFLLIAVFVTIADVVVFVMLMVLIARIVMLWFLIVLSPFAFVLSIMPGAAQKYAGQWWSEFTNYAIVGPAMAFFLWLSLAVVAKTNNTANITKQPGIAGSQLIDKESEQFKNTDTNVGKAEAVNVDPDVGTTAVGTLSGMLNYILGIGMLMGTLMIAQQLGVAGGKMAGAAVGGIGDVLSGKRGLVPWRTMAGTAWNTFEGKQMDTWKKRGERLGLVGARVADSTIGKLAPTKAGRAEAQTRIEAHKEETTKRKMDNFAKAGDFAKLSPQELRNQLAKEKNGMRRAALVSEINKRGELGNEKGDNALIAHQAEFLDQNGGAHMQVEFDDQIKKANLTAAFQSGRFNDEHGQLSIDKFFSELKSGKFSSESVTDEMLHSLETKNNTDADAAVTQKRAGLDKEIAKAVKAGDQEKVRDLFEQKEKLDDYSNTKLARKEEIEGLRAQSQEKKDTAQKIRDQAKAENDRELTPEEVKKIELAEEQASALNHKAQNAERADRNTQAAAYEMAGHKMLGNRLVEGMKDAKQISTIISGLSTNTWRALEKNTSLLKGVTDEQRIAFARSKGAYELAFDTDTDFDKDSEEGKKRNARLKELEGKKTLTGSERNEMTGLQDSKKQQDLFREQILSKGDKRDEFYKIIDKQSAGNKNIWKIVSENNDWKAAYAQRVALYRDAEKKDAIKFSAGELIDDMNKNGKEKGGAETIRDVRIRNLLHGVSRQNQYVSADGRTKDIYDFRGEARLEEILQGEGYGIDAETLRGMSHEDKLATLKTDGEREHIKEVGKNAGESYKMQISHDRLQADELEDQDWKGSGASKESMEAFLEAYSSEQQRKIVAVNKELERKMLEYRPEHLEKTARGHLENVAQAKQTHGEGSGEHKAAQEIYDNWKKGQVATSNRMAKGDNTYTGLPVYSEAATTELLGKLETEHGYGGKSSATPASAPATAPAATAPPPNARYVTGEGADPAVTRGGVVLNVPPRQQQPRQPRQQPPPPTSPPEEYDPSTE
ncbi:MAG: hypothetical protein AAB416_02215 [Patescibacteria group bacterium]